MLPRVISTAADTAALASPGQTGLLRGVAEGVRTSPGLNPFTLSAPHRESDAPDTTAGAAGRSAAGLLPTLAAGFVSPAAAAGVGAIQTGSSLHEGTLETLRAQGVPEERAQQISGLSGLGGAAVGGVAGMIAPGPGAGAAKATLQAGIIGGGTSLGTQGINRLATGQPISGKQLAIDTGVGMVLGAGGHMVSRGVEGAIESPHQPIDLLAGRDAGAANTSSTPDTSAPPPVAPGASGEGEKEPVAEANPVSEPISQEEPKRAPIDLLATKTPAPALPAQQPPGAEVSKESALQDPAQPGTGEGIPLPPLHEDVAPQNVQRAWDIVSQRYPKIAGAVKRIEPLDTYKYGFDKNASFDPGSGVLRVNLDKVLQPSSLAHEFTHVAQSIRNQPASPSEFASEEQFKQKIEEPAYRRGEAFKQFDEPVSGGRAATPQSIPSPASETQATPDIEAGGPRAADQSAGAGKMVEQPASVDEKQLPLGVGPASPNDPAFSYATEKESPTSIRNATVDQERTERGLKPAMQSAQRSFGDVWDAAMKEVDKNPAAQDDVINELRSKPRAVTDREDALLLHRQIDLQNQYDGEAKALEQAQTANDPEGVAEHRVKVAALSDKLLDLYNINKKVGTETGRGLNARKMLAQEDFTLASMETQKRAANQGQELTPLQKVQLKAQHENIVKAQTALDEYTKQQEATKQKSLERQIEFLNKRISAGDVAAKQKAPTAESKVITELKTKRDALSKQMKSMREGDPAAKAIVNQIALLEKRIATGEAGAKAKPVTADTKALAELKAKRDLLNAQLKASRGDASALNAYKSRTMKRIGHLVGKVGTGDFSMPDRTEIKLDEHAVQLKAQLERYKQMFTDGVEKDRLKQRTPAEKFQDTWVKVRRASLLSSPITLAKLTSAAAERMVFSPAEEVVGGIYSKAFPKLAAGAPREGRLSVRAEANAFTEGLTTGMSDAWKTLRTGKSDLDTLYGEKHPIPPSWIDFIGNIHSALKAPAKRAEFARSVQKRAEAAMLGGLDPHEPLVMGRIMIDAYKDAKSAIFMQDNRGAEAIKQMERTLERPDKTTGKPTVGGKIGATAIKTVLPIVKVPMNVLAETLRYAFGLPVGAGKLMHAYATGIDKLPPQHRDAIFGLLKKGSVGSAGLLIGYLNPDNVGGYYQPGEKRKDGDVKAGGLRVAGVNIVRWLVHFPGLETLQIGATVRRVADSYFRKHDKESEGMPSGIAAAGFGLAEELPMTRSAVDLAKMVDPRTRDKAVGSFVRDLAVPEGVQFAADKTDQNSAGDAIDRKPRGVIQNIETGIPGLRQTVQNIPKNDEEWKNVRAESAVDIYEAASKEQRVRIRGRVMAKIFGSKSLKPSDRASLRERVLTAK